MQTQQMMSPAPSLLPTQKGYDFFLMLSNRKYNIPLGLMEEEEEEAQHFLHKAERKRDVKIAVESPRALHIYIKSKKKEEKESHYECLKV